ncbi:polysaccharide pyruvyl transferase family protein [Arthrobacter sp. JZ12]|uniref:polysaccharide pyruvyl transferase family protein n=1 Tax=Arthrobacter sp. JZ12 TaxID=2654190 RepID=UPI002B47A3A7|nr:polysaccharide pyruvyl transferase family protein [Arthrobacter sp. JZ12]
MASVDIRLEGKFVGQEHVVGWLDPSLNSRNTGDQIIADAVETELAGMLPDSYLLRLPTQTYLTRKERQLAAHCSDFVVGGTNLLNGNIPTYIQWKLDPHTVHTYKGSVSLLGVGWWQYQAKPNLLSRSLWRGLLGAGVNSVRDGYTQKMLTEVGVESINTGCPTMWRLPSEIPVSDKRPSGVIMTLTDYHRNPLRDAKLVRGLKERYEEVLVWPQGSKDRTYVRSLDRGVQFLGDGLEDFNSALNSRQFDYVGTRLHAGVRALQLGAKSTIVAVDNRAVEIAKHTGLPVISGNLEARDWAVVDERSDIRLELPREAINNWKAAFVAAVAREI